ncbi:hypothetical protein LR032_04430, partial [Candidatus Bipolaricaulota bacterium]|nr:hypothetical protein [Candidatus Bipolaricaulota bacterium]
MSHRGELYHGEPYRGSPKTRCAERTSVTAAIERPLALKKPRSGRRGPISTIETGSTIGPGSTFETDSTF